MIPVYIDMETFWSTTHSLSKMNPILYVMHPETEIQSVALAIGDGPIEVIFGYDNIAKRFAQIDWSNALCVAHNNSGFDALIMAWRFGIKPKAWACTLAMGRPIHGLRHGVSLKALAEAEGLPAKGSLEEVNTKGKKLKDFTPEEIAKMTVYNQRDTYLCRELFKRFMAKLGLREMKQIDVTIRTTTEPEFEADIPLLELALADEIGRKKASLLKLASMCGVYQNGMDEDMAAQAMKDIVMSQPQFAKLLESMGVEVPMKESKTAVDENGYPKMIPALAKQDQGMTDLLDYEDPDGNEEREHMVRVAAAVRLEVKSTQLETRLRTYIDVAKALGGKLPMPLNYCGAMISWRESGGMKMNVQNMPRIGKKPSPKDALRKSIKAPPGYVVVACDSSNIELRVAHCLAGQQDTIAKLRNKEDLYCWFASILFGRKITKADEVERFIGKVAMLSLQYGASWKPFQSMVRVQSQMLVQSGVLQAPMIMSEEECKNIVNVWRKMFPALAGTGYRGEVRGIWKKCDDAIKAMFEGEHMMLDEFGLVHTTKDALITPDGHWLQYPDLRGHVNSKGKTEWQYGQKQNKSKIYGSMLFENICQHIARIIVMEQRLKIAKRYKVKLSCHDEVVALAKIEEADECRDYMLQCMSASPSWWPDLPLAAECKYGARYSDAK